MPDCTVPATSDFPWPVCPGCGAKRVTRCPFCSTSGADFEPAAVDFGRLLGLSGKATGAPSCGPGGCSPVKEIAPSEKLHQLSGQTASAETPDAPMLLCPTCDEPFTPQFANRCRGCDHAYPDGYEDCHAERAAEGVNQRVLLCLGGIVLFSAGALLYFWRLF